MKNRKSILAAGLISGLMLAALPQQAFALPPIMRITGTANPPIGHYDFCKTNQSECRPTSGDAGPMTLTEKRWRQILDINFTVNTQYQPMTDQEIYGVEEKWAYPTTAADCEDYVLEKRKRLIEKGVAPSDLLITVVLQPNGEGHAVLTVRTDRGEFVLDNMRNKVLLWSETEYTYLKRQASDNPGRWVKIQDGRSSAVGSVRP